VPRLAAVPAALLIVLAVPGLSAQPAASQPSDPLLRGLRWRVIGPIGQGGRVNDIAVDEKDPTTFYTGFATGGLWKTSNAGITVEPVFDRYGTHSIGDIALAPSSSEVVYVGTGEPNNRQSSSFGDGVYKSTDGGKTFIHAGLRETQSIARIVVHPTNAQVVWVAAVGHLFGPNAERGVFKSTDGGGTWQKVLYVDEHTGATDIVIHPANPNELWAATYQRRRTPWGFASGGANSGIWKSTDGGDNWTRVSGNGLPGGSMARIGLDISRSNPQVIYAQIEVGPDREPRSAAAPAGGGGQAGGGGGGGGGQGGQALPPDPQVSGVWRSSDGGRTWEFRSNQNNRPMYYSQIRIDPNDENTVYVGGAGASKSTDGGRTWRTLSGFGHGDHRAIWINPKDSRHVMYGNDGGVDVSHDGAVTWESLRSWAVGQPYYASVDMRRPYFVCTGLQDNGSWCGPSSARSSPILPEDWYRVGGGDGFWSAVDPTDHTILYTESQNGAMNRLDLRAGTSTSIRPRGGINPTIRPLPDTGLRLRWNWSTPIVLSPHNPRTILTGANRFFRSTDRGETWTMSADLTRGIDRDQREILGYKGSLPGCGRARVGACILSRNDGTSFYGTIISVAESPALPGVYWVGTDDGNIQVSRDGGASWTEVGKNIPGGPLEYYVSRVEPSYVDPATAYVSLDGHRSDDLKPYIFVTRDFGRSWTPIAGNLPAFGNVNTVRQDPKNPRLLYAGTEFGFFVSPDEGAQWKPLTPGLPVVRIDDVVIHPRDNDLVLSTHGRSVWVMDDITALQQLTPAVLASDVTLFVPREAVAWKEDITLRRSVTGAKRFRGENAPAGSAISYYLKSPASGVKLTITDPTTGAVFRTLTATGEAGINRVQWDLCSDPRPAPPGQGGFGGGGAGACAAGPGGGGGGQGGPQQSGRPAAPGVYRVTLTAGGKDYTQLVRVLEDVWLDQR
jgi:photosystem II stability/assembly factor-like uncharacterized protein